MTQGARKRAARWTTDGIYLLDTNGLDTYMDAWHAWRAKHGSELRIGQRLRPCPGCAKCLRCLCGNSAACIGLYEAWTKHQKAEPACNDCCGHGCEDGHCDKVEDICDGSGVIPAKARKVRR